MPNLYERVIAIPDQTPAQHYLYQDGRVQCLRPS